MVSRGRRIALMLAAGAVVIGVFWIAAGRLLRDPLPPGDYEPRRIPDWEVSGADATALREDALERAQVWGEPAEPVERADLARNPGDSQPLDTAALVCKFLPRPSSGTTPKFECILPGGEVIKVKYGRNPEIHAELAATRLLAALGFAADRMYLVPRLRCHGCPGNPFRTYRVLELFRSDEVYTQWIDYDAYTDFEWVSVERRLAAPAITTPAVEGWAFHELDRIDPVRGGASRAQVDALRLMAVFLHHWDNKPENQRLVCLARPGTTPRGPCPAPLAFLQDVGATFGPTKVSLPDWSGRAVWSDPSTCELSMTDLPANGATFAPVRITEGGRRFLAERLGRLSEKQLRDLFTGARFAEYHPAADPGAIVLNWVRAFQGKVREIRDRPPCPALTSGAGASRGPRSLPSG